MLLEKNSNAGIELGMFDGGSTLFPPSKSEKRIDRLSATIFMVDEYAEVYQPNSTCQIIVAHIGVCDNNDRPMVEMRNLDLWGAKYCDKIRQHNGPKRCGTISSKKVAKNFSEIQEDIREIFDLPR